LTRVLLINADSTGLPPLSLIKISTWHKRQGDEVSFNMKNPDIVYGCVIFKRNKHLADGWRFMYPNAKVIVGGSGYDLHKELPPEVEAMPPDYSLFPEMDYSMIHTSRGCIRHCYFCVVPEKEGRYRRVEKWKDGINPNFKKAKLLDNNWYADKEWFMETSAYFRDNKIAIDVTQGMDIRLLDEEIAKRLKELTIYPKIHFAFDDWNYAEKVKEGIDILNKAGIKVRNEVLFFVYCNGPEQVEDAAARADQLKEWGALPMIMNNIDVPKTQEMIDLYRYCMPWNFWAVKSWNDYSRKYQALQRKMICLRKKK